MALFPTDKIGGNQITLSQLTPTGTIHLAGVFIIFLLFPFGVYALSKSLSNEQTLSNYALFTSICVYTICLLCYIWSYFFLTGNFSDYLGILQKIIAGICLFWMISIIKAVKC